MKKTQKFSVEIPSKNHQALKLLCVKREISMAKIVNALIDEYLKKEEKK